MYYYAKETSNVYWFKTKSGEKFSSRFNSTSAAIDYAQRNGYEFLGTHSHITINSCHPNFYLN